MTAFIPANFDVKKHISDYPPNLIPDFSEDKLIYIIGLPISILANNKNKRDKSGFVNLNSNRLQRTIGPYYRKYLDYLVESNVIEEDRQFVKGEFSRSFRFLPHYSRRFTEIEIGKALSSKIKKASLKEIRIQQNEEKYKMVNHLRKWFTTSKLEYDFKKAKIFLEEFFLGKKKLRINKGRTKQGAFDYQQINKKPKQERSKKEKQFLKYYRNLLAAKRLCNLREGIYTFKVDDSAGRLHSNFTGLKKELRNFLTFGGKPLVEIDIACSQLFFSLAILNEQFYKVKKLTKKTSGVADQPVKGLKDLHNINTPINSILNNDLSINIFKILNKSFININPFNKIINNDISLTKILERIQNIDNKELNHYKEQVTEGTIYDCMISNYKGLYSDKLMDRDKVKKLVFTVLFSLNENEVDCTTPKDYILKGQRQVAKEIFRMSFPTIMDVFEEIKSGQNNLLALLLQTVEAHVMLDKVCWRIKRERPGLPIFTIHDSILTTEGNQLSIIKIMEEEFLKAVGLTPKLTVKVRTPDSLKIPSKIKRQSKLKAA